MRFNYECLEIIKNEEEREEWYVFDNETSVQVIHRWWLDEEESHPLMVLYFLLRNKDKNNLLASFRILCSNPETIRLPSNQDWSKDDWICFCEDYNFNYQASPTFTTPELKTQGINAYLEDVRVEPRYRNQGFGTQLIEFAKDYLRYRQLSNGLLTYPFAVEAKENPEQTHRVQQFYERIGFEPWQHPYYCCLF